MPQLPPALISTRISLVRSLDNHLHHLPAPPDIVVSNAPDMWNLLATLANKVHKLFHRSLNPAPDTSAATPKASVLHRPKAPHSPLPQEFPVEEWQEYPQCVCHSRQLTVI